MILYILQQYTDWTHQSHFLKNSRKLDNTTLQTIQTSESAEKDNEIEVAITCREKGKKLPSSLKKIDDMMRSNLARRK